MHILEGCIVLVDNYGLYGRIHYVCMYMCIWYIISQNVQGSCMCETVYSPMLQLSEWMDDGLTCRKLLRVYTWWLVYFSIAWYSIACTDILMSFTKALRIVTIYYYSMYGFCEYMLYAFSTWRSTQLINCRVTVFVT